MEKLKLSNILCHLDIFINSEPRYFTKLFFKDAEDLFKLTEKKAEYVLKILIKEFQNDNEFQNLFKYDKVEKTLILDFLIQNDLNFCIELLLQKNIEYRNNLNFYYFFNNKYTNIKISKTSSNLSIGDTENYKLFCLQNKIFPTYRNFKFDYK